MKFLHIIFVIGLAACSAFGMSFSGVSVGSVSDKFDVAVVSRAFYSALARGEYEKAAVAIGSTADLVKGDPVWSAFTRFDDPIFTVYESFPMEYGEKVGIVFIYSLANGQETSHLVNADFWYAVGDGASVSRLSNILRSR